MADGRPVVDAAYLRAAAARIERDAPGFAARLRREAGQMDGLPVAELVRPGGEDEPRPGWRYLGVTVDGSPLYAAVPGTPGDPPAGEAPWADPGHDVAGDFRAALRAVEEEGEGWRRGG